MARGSLSTEDDVAILFFLFFLEGGGVDFYANLRINNFSEFSFALAHKVRMRSEDGKICKKNKCGTVKKCLNLIKIFSLFSFIIYFISNYQVYKTPITNKRMNSRKFE